MPFITRSDAPGMRPAGSFTRRVGAILAAGLMALAATAAHGQEKTVRAVMHSGLRILDPILSPTHIVRNHGYMIYDQLVAMDANDVVQPQMASWEISGDGLTYTFKLRDGLLFHDGAPVTAADAVASVKRWGARDAAGKFLMAATDTIEAADQTTIVWKLKEAFPQLLNVLAKPSSVAAFIMPARVAATPADTTITEYVGSGPFEFVASEFQPGVKVVYKRFDKYKPRAEPASGLAGGKVVNVDRVEQITMPDSQTAVNALMTGEIDLIERVPIDLLPILETDPEISVEAREKLGQQALLRMSFIHPPFDNVEIRRAALTALSQEEIMTAVAGTPDYYWLCGAIFGCQTPLGSETGADLLKAGGDKAKAREMLKAAGYDNTPVVVLQATDFNEQGRVATVVASELREVGFNVDLQPMDWQTLVTRLISKNKPSEGGWNMYFGAVSYVDSNTPLVHPYLASTGENGWFGWADDPQVEELRATFRTAATLEEQKAVADKIQARVLDNVLFVPLGNYATVQARSKKLIDQLPVTIPVFWNLKVAD